jgi:NodT family efflux transporter outer membrane factor (OMF) lipoprotein
VLRLPSRIHLEWPLGKCAVVPVILAIVAIGGCTVGPKYTRPSAEVPPAFREAGPDWKVAEPSDAIAKGKWWEIYGDPQLNSLEEQVSVSNESLKAEEEQFAQAREAIRISRSQYYPQITAGALGAHYSESPNRPLNLSLPSYQDYQIPVQASWEPDLWGRVRRTVEASRSEAQATAADLANVDLSLHAELAQDYFELRGLDAQKKLLDSTVDTYQRALDLTESRYNGGVASAVDVAQAQTQLETTRAQDQDVDVARAAYEHAIAVLTGKPPYELTVPPLPLTTPPPVTPVSAPSQLLERRPDIAAAERRMQEANARIGVAETAYYPTISLSASGGFESGSAGTLLQGDSGFWSLAGSAAELIFDGGQRRGLTEQARAAYRQSVDNYRQTTLTAFQEVEDNLAALRVLQTETGTEEAAVATAQHSLDLSITRYKGGVANYLEVTTAQSAALSDEITALNILSRQFSASILLVKALGGGWDVSKIPAM